MELVKVKGEIKEITNIGGELKFQRLYYNAINSSKKLFLDRTNHPISNDLAEQLAKVIEKLTGKSIERNSNTNTPKGLSYDVLSNIETNNLVKEKYNQKHKEVQTMDNYYLIMFYMLKLYGFLDDFDIFMLLKKYKIKPKKGEMQEKVDKLKESYINEYKKNPYIHFFNLNNTSLTIPIKLWRCFQKNKRVFILGRRCADKKNRFIVNMDYKEFKERIFIEFTDLSNEEKKYVSLLLGKESNFIDDLLNGKIKYITYNTLLKTLEFFNFKSTELYHILRTYLYFKENDLKKVVNEENKLINILNSI